MFIEYGTAFDGASPSSFANIYCGKNIVIFVVSNTLSRH